MASMKTTLIDVLARRIIDNDPRIPGSEETYREPGYPESIFDELYLIARLCHVDTEVEQLVIRLEAERARHP